MRVATTADQISSTSRQLSEYEALIAAAPSALDAIPGAVYLCDADGWLVRYNSEAQALWGRKPPLGGNERFCGSHRLYLTDGTPLPRESCPMADAVQIGRETRNAEVVMERPDGTKFPALVNIRPLHDHDGTIQGAINCFQDISARKAIEEELLRRNNDLEDFFENAAVGLHIVSGEGTILRANRAELDMLGYSAEEYVGRPITDFHADADTIADILQRLSCGDSLRRYPARLRAKDGSIRHVLITSNSRFDDGQFVSTRCFTIDVTEAEEAQQEGDRRLAATYEAAPVGIAEVDEQGRYVRVNDAFCTILGRSREDALSSDLLEITHPDDRAREAEKFRQQVRGELEGYSLEKRAVRPDGSIVHLEISSSSVRDAHGRFKFGVRIMQDVTERKRMQEEISANERRLRELLEALPAAVYTTDEKGRITFYNQAAVELAGRQPELGDEWCVTWKLLRPDGTPLPHDQCPMAVALRENRAVRGAEAIAERPDGVRVPFEPFPTPLRDAEGELVGAINMLVDITDRKAAEARQKVLIDELNHRVKNTLATVQSLAQQTAKHARDVPDFGARFEARLMALAKAHDLLTKRNWTSAPLASLLHDVVAPYGGGVGERVRLDGPHLDLNPRAALPMTMVLNELATNAAKYGALSRPSGTLSVAWRLSSGKEPTLELDWLERGGPQVSEPTRQGFGTRLIERCIQRDLDGQLDLQFAMTGVHCRICVPFEVLTVNA